MAFRKTVLVGINQAKLDADDFKQLDKYCPNRVFLPRESPDRHAHLKDADCILGVLGLKFDASDFAAAPQLKYLGLLSTGYGGVDLQAAAKHGITVTNIPGYSTDSVAELTIGMLLEHFRDLEKAKRLARQGVHADAPLRARELKGKTLAVLGMGQIGTRVAQLANAFGCTVIYWSRERKPEVEKQGIAFVALEDLLSRADILSINLALNNQTLGFLNKDRIHKLKKETIVVSTAPLALTDVDALTQRVERKELTLIFDHTDQGNPAQIEKLKTLENCVAYPHMGFNTDEARLVRQKIFFENMNAYLNGQPTNNITKG